MKSGLLRPTRNTVNNPGNLYGDHDKLHEAHAPALGAHSILPGGDISHRLADLNTSTFVADYPAGVMAGGGLRGVASSESQYSLAYHTVVKFRGCYGLGLTEQGTHFMRAGVMDKVR